MENGIDYGQYERGRYCNYWELDGTIQRELRRVYPDDEFEWANPRLSEFGELVGQVLADNADYADRHGPELQTYDRNGEVQNYVDYPAALKETERLAYEAGVVADSFETPPGRNEPLSHAHYFGMLYLLSYAETTGFVCPVAMTAGAAHVLELFDDGALEPYYEGLTSRDHDNLIEGAMFLTEKQGGSDVGANETRAEYDEESGYWRLTGEKWFCSNIDAEGTLTLARTPDAPEGTKGLSMFLVPHGDPDSGVMTKGDREAFDGPPPADVLNDQYYRRLKDKLGTTNVPTGEVEFEETKALLVGEEEAGFKQMAEMLNLERLSNAAGACGIMGRALLESKIHAANREAFGRPLEEFPLMRADLVEMAVDHEAATAFTFEAVRYFAKREQGRRVDNETGAANDAYRLMRLLAPVAKLKTARVAIETTSYAMEIRGGDGYTDDFVTNRLLRDAQVLPIWEGTENILALDVLRALDREIAHEPFSAVMDDRLATIDHPILATAAETVESEYYNLLAAMTEIAGRDEEYAQLSAKRLATYIFDVFTGALLLAEAQEELERENGRLALIAQRFIDRELTTSDARGITSGDNSVLEHFDPIVRFESVEVDEMK